MNIPAIINHLLTLRYPGDDKRPSNRVCHQNVVQLIIPMTPAGVTINYTGRPLPGTYGFLQFDVRWGSDMVPNAFISGMSQYGNIPINVTLTQQWLNNNVQFFLLITAQEPDIETLTNISPLPQRYEILIHYLVIPGEREMEIIIDALRRLHTSTRSEELLQQADYLLSILAKQRPTPGAPPVGGS